MRRPRTAEDTGGETGAVIYDKAAVRALTATGTWAISTSRTSVLRLALKGSERARGVLASNYAQPKVDDKGTDDTADDVGLQQEIISLGDLIGFGFELGGADRYLIRGVSFNMDDSTPSGSGFTNPFDLRSGSRTGAVQFSLVNTRKAPGLPVWTAPQGATVAGGCPTVMSVETCKEYVFDQPIGPDAGYENKRRRDAVLQRVAGAPSDGVDDPPAAGVSITGAKADVALNDPLMAVLGEPLEAMVQNLGQTNNGYVSADTTNDVLSQGFTTGSAPRSDTACRGSASTSKAPAATILTGRPPCRWPSTPIRAGSRARSWSTSSVPPNTRRATASSRRRRERTCGGAHFLRAGLEPPRRHRAQAAEDLEQ